MMNDYFIYDDKTFGGVFFDKKTNEEIADEVSHGKWGYGFERVARLMRAGYDYCAIQDIINYRLMNARKNGTDTIKKIIFNQKACIVFWKDGTKTIVKRKENDKFDKYAAVAQAIAKHQYGSTSAFHKMVDSVSVIKR